MFLFFPHWERFYLLGLKWNALYLRSYARWIVQHGSKYKSATSNGFPLCWFVYFCSSIAVLFQGRGQQVMKDYLQIYLWNLYTIVFAAAKMYEHPFMLQKCLLTNSHQEISNISSHHISYITRLVWIVFMKCIVCCMNLSLQVTLFAANKISTIEMECNLRNISVFHLLWSIEDIF
jgi:hypothetical protein